MGKMTEWLSELRKVWRKKKMKAAREGPAGGAQPEQNKKHKKKKGK